MIVTLKLGVRNAAVGNAQTQPRLPLSATSQVNVRTALNTPSQDFHSQVIAPRTTNSNGIAPSYNLKLQPTSLLNTNSVSKFVEATRKFQPYELLTGISHDSPVIVMLTGFLPLFIHDVVSSDNSTIKALEAAGIRPYMTDAGRFIDLQINSTNVQFDDITYLLSALRDKYPNIDADIKQRVTTFKNAMKALGDTSNFLLTLNRGLAHLRQMLDLRDDIHIVNTNDIITFYVLNFEKNNALTTSHPLFDIAGRYTPQSYTLVDAMTRLGYDVSATRNVFSSTKLWLQFVSELKIILQKHSLEFLGLKSQRTSNDTNAAILTRPSATEPGNVHRFDVNPNLTNVPVLSDLTTIPPSHFKSTIDIISRVYDKIYIGTDSILTNEMGIAAIVNVLSKELRYSAGLGRQDVQLALSSGYGYNVVAASSNVGVWDAVMGVIGNNITDVPTSQPNSLVSLAYRTPATSVNVATFESKYVDGDTGTLTAGGDFYARDVIGSDGVSFDTTNMDELAIFMNAANMRLGTIINGLNALAYSDPNDKTPPTIMSSPTGMIKRLLDKIIDNQTLRQLPEFSEDNLTPLYVTATKNSNVKALLFIHAAARMTRTYKTNAQTNANADNTVLTSYIEDTVLKALDKLIPTTSAASGLLNTTLNSQQLKALGAVGNKVSGVPSITKQAIKRSLASGTSLSKIVEAFMNDVLVSFYDAYAISNSRTLYGSYIDTIVMMIAFDIAIRTIATFSDKSFTGASSANNVSSAAENTQGYVVSGTQIDHSTTYTTLIARLEREQAFTQMLVYSVINTLKSIAGAASGYSSYLSSPSTSSAIKSVASVVDDTALLKLLLGPQQAMLSSASVNDVTLTLATSTTNRNDILAFDGLAIPKTLRDIMYGFFGTSENASVLGYNKKILTVGVPVGFSQHIKQRVNIQTLQRTTFANKKDDIVNVAVYRSDINNSDIIYKPIRYTFELSRFPIRNSLFLLEPPQKPTLDDVVRSVPMRVYDSKTFTQRAEYWHGTNILGAGSALASEEYAFLSASQKYEIARNHVMSYLAEVYIRLLTGISTAEDRFDIVEHPQLVEPAFVQTIVDHSVAMINSIANANNVSVVQKQVPVGSVLFSTTSPKNTVDGPVTLSSTSDVRDANALAALKKAGTSVAANSSDQTSLDSPATVTVLQTVSNLSLMTTQLSDPNAASTRMLRPKQFDRVFNIIVDPDDFEIDVNETAKTQHGKLVLQQLISSGDVVPTPVMDNTNAPTNKYVYRRRNKKQGDMTLDKYFVSIETLDEAVK